MKDMALSENGDIFIDDSGNAIIVDSLDEVKQRLHTRLLRFLGEWYLNTTLGVPYIQDILIKNPSQSTVINNIKKIILETQEVTAITSFEMRLATDSNNNIVQRSVIIDFDALTDQGNITLEVSASIN